MSDIQDVQVKNEQPQAADGQPDPNAKNVINYTPMFPVMSVSVNLDIDFEDTLTQIYKTVGDISNSPIGYSSIGVNPEQVKNLDKGQEIEGAIYGVVTNTMDELKLDYDKEKCMIRMWLNVVRKDNYVPRTYFGMSQFTGVIILKCDKECSPLVLHSPHAPYRGHDLMPHRIADLGPFTAPNATLDIAPGRMFVWPSWIHHEVPHMVKGGPLIYVGFTIDFLPRGA